MTYLFELYRTDRYENQSVKWLIFSFAKTNLIYIEPHRTIIKNITFLVLIIQVTYIFQM